MKKKLTFRFLPQQIIEKNSLTTYHLIQKYFSITLLQFNINPAWPFTVWCLSYDYAILYLFPTFEGLNFKKGEVYVCRGAAVAASSHVIDSETHALFVLIGFQ